MDPAQIASIVVFVVVMTLVVSEKVHRALAAVLGAMALILIHILSFETAVHHIDFNTLAVLFGMMLFVAVVKRSGLFEVLSVMCVRGARGNPWRIMLLLVLLTAVLSALLDNVTTVLLIGPMTVTICKLLDLNPLPYFMTEILSSNIGGTATLVGDPPNIMIGSAAGFSFADFLVYDAPVVVVILAVVLVIFYFLYGRKMSVSDRSVQKVMELDAGSYVKSGRLLKLSVAMIAVVVAGFMMHEQLGVESGVVAMTAGGLMLLLSREPIEEALLDVEWTTLVFFAGLFIVVGALSETGVILLLANALIDATQGNLFALMMILLIGSAVISSFLDNIPFVATMIPILLAIEGTGMDVTPLWWSLSLGACLGGNGTLIGASANVVLSDVAKKNGYELTFLTFLKTGFPLMLLTVLIAGAYLMVRFPV